MSSWATQGHPRRGHRRQDRYSGVAGRRGDPRWTPHLHYPNDQKQREASRPVLDALYAYLPEKARSAARVSLEPASWSSRAGSAPASTTQTPTSVVVPAAASLGDERRELSERGDEALSAPAVSAMRNARSAPAMSGVEVPGSVRREGSGDDARDYHRCMLRSIEPSDEALAERVGEGDIVAFATLYDRYARRVYAWATRILGPGDADDATQEVFLRLWDRARQFDRARGLCGAWFAAVSRHEIIGRARRRAREQRLVVSEEIDELLAQAPDPRPSVEARAWMTERDASLAAAVRELPADQRRVIVMAYFGGLSQSEIAAAISAPLGTVKKRTSLALAKLRRAIAQHGSAPAREG